MPHRFGTIFLHLALSVVIMVSTPTGEVKALIARGQEPEKIPVKQLTDTFKSVLKKDSGNARAHYRLGRTHYFAYYLESRKIYGLAPDNDDSDTGLPAISDFRRIMDRNRMFEFTNKRSLPDTEALNHLRNGIKHHRKALQIKKNPLYHLGLASLLDQGSRDAGRISESLLPDVPSQVTSELLEDPSTLQARWLGLALLHYWKAFNGSIQKDLARVSIPYQISHTISHEAGKNYQHLLKSLNPDRENSLFWALDGWSIGWLARVVGAGDRWDQRYFEIERKLNDMQEKVRGVVTPIIFSRKPTSSWRSLIDSKSTVKFDLTGTGKARRWEWVKPTTGFLVWTPEHPATITSGRQLFGSVTWWMFWEHGYEPLASLDRDNSGWLRDEELQNISAWFDRNQNGRTDAGEVLSLRKIGVEALAVEPTGREGTTLKASPGIILEDGLRLPTWDWKAKPE
ncbi:MAG: hypothetical protein ABEK50_04170 [bacterium]